MKKKRCMVTVFTPVYNRAYSIGKLYDSLKRQSCRDFEWVIVDDGSTDEIEKTVSSFISQNSLPITFERQPNGGKHSAINRGVGLASGEYFYIVDSDDYIPDDAVEIICKHIGTLPSDGSFAGICGLDRTIEGRVMSVFPPVDFIDATSADIRYKYKVCGDMAEVFRTEILRRYPFPVTPGERFCPEALVWNRIARDGYKLRYIPDVLKIIEYLPDGITASIVRVRAKSPVASTICYAEQCALPIPLMHKIKSAINYWRFNFCKSAHKKASIPFKWFWTLPFGFLMHLKDLRSI